MTNVKHHFLLQQQQQQPQQQPHHGPALFASYDLEDFSSTDHSMHRPPIDNRYNYYEHATTTPTKSAQVLLRPRPLKPSSSMLLQFSNNSILDKGGEGDDSSRDAPSVRQHSNAFRKVASSSSSYSSTDRYPEISPADTYTTVSLSQELEDDYDSDDDHDLHSQASTELVSHLFRKKEGFKSNNEEDHEAYGYLLRMKTQNYIHSSTEEQQQEQQQHEESDDTNRLRFVYRETLPPLMPEF